MISCWELARSLQKLKYDIHNELPLEHTKFDFSMIPVVIWYEYHTSVFAIPLSSIAMCACGHEN